MATAAARAAVWRTGSGTDMSIGLVCDGSRSRERVPRAAPSPAPGAARVATGAVSGVGERVGGVEQRGDGQHARRGAGGQPVLDLARERNGVAVAQHRERAAQRMTPAQCRGGVGAGDGGALRPPDAAKSARSGGGASGGGASGAARRGSGPSRARRSAGSQAWPGGRSPAPGGNAVGSRCALRKSGRRGARLGGASGRTRDVQAVLAGAELQVQRRAALEGAFGRCASASRPRLHGAVWAPRWRSRPAMTC